MSYKILVINPGSTSTKIGVYEDETLLFEETLRHSTEEIAKYATIVDQKDFRKELIVDILAKNSFDIKSLNVVVGRGGLLKPIPGGTYPVSDALLADLKAGVQGQHASNLGGILAREIGDEIGVPSYIVDPVVVDEMEPVARYSGIPELPRISIFHALNQKAVAKRYAKEQSVSYDSLNLVVVHMGGGVSVGAHKNGKVVDVNNTLDGDGPFSPERSGGVPAGALVKMCFSGQYTQAEVYKKINGKGGLNGYLGTNNMRDVAERAFEKGDEEAAGVFHAFTYQVAKEVGAMAAVLNGKVDQILLTGGIAYSDYVTSEIKEKVSDGWENMKTTVTTKMTEWKTNASNKLNEIKTNFSTKVSDIKSNVSTGWENMKTTVTTKMTEWKNNASNKLTEIKSGFSSKVSEIKTKWSTDFTNIKDKATSLMETAKSNVSTKLDHMKSAYSEKGGGIKGIVSATFTGIKDTMNSLMSTANTLTGGKLDSIKSAFSSKLASAKSTASSAMENIKSSFSSKMESAHGAVTGALSRIKSAFNFKWSLPHLNLPHISVSGGKAPYGIGGKGSLPSFSIQWYKSGGIMTNPTVFGINGNSLMVGGEAGDEAILPLAEFYNKLNNILDKKLDAVQKSNIVYVTNHTYIDGDEVASRTVSRVDAQMVTDKRKGR